LAVAITFSSPLSDSSTEDLVSMLEEMGVATGVELAKLIEASAEAQRVLGRPLGAHVLVAGPVDWHR
jgi:hydroxymethylglutaryl-CoA lyase